MCSLRHIVGSLYSSRSMVASFGLPLNIYVPKVMSISLSWVGLHFAPCLSLFLSVVAVSSSHFLQGRSLRTEVASEISPRKRAQSRSVQQHLCPKVIKPFGLNWAYCSILGLLLLLFWCNKQPGPCAHKQQVFECIQTVDGNSGAQLSFHIQLDHEKRRNPCMWKVNTSGKVSL